MPRLYLFVVVSHVRLYMYELCCCFLFCRTQKFAQAIAIKREWNEKRDKHSALQSFDRSHHIINSHRVFTVRIRLRSFKPASTVLSTFHFKINAFFFVVFSYSSSMSHTKKKLFNVNFCFKLIHQFRLLLIIFWRQDSLSLEFFIFYLEFHAVFLSLAKYFIILI